MSTPDPPQPDDGTSPRTPRGDTPSGKRPVKAPPPCEIDWMTAREFEEWLEGQLNPTGGDAESD